MGGRRKQIGNPEYVEILEVRIAHFAMPFMQNNFER
jgi:hypothetical protein